MNPKILFVILILLIVLFAVGAGLGAGGRSGPVGSSPDSWLDTLGDVLVRKQRLAVEDVSAAIPPECARQLLENNVLVLGQGLTCTLFVQEGSASVRTLPLRSRAGGVAEVRFDPADENRLTAEQTLEGERRQMDVQIFEGGGELRLSCLAGGGAGDACRIEVERE